MSRLIPRVIFAATLAGFVFIISNLAFYALCRIGGHNITEFMYGTTSPTVFAVGTMLLAVWLTKHELPKMK